MVRKRPRIGIVPRLTLGTAAAIGVIPACVLMSCSSGTPEANCGSDCPDVASSLDSPYQAADVAAAFDVTSSFEASPPDEAGSDAEDAMSGDAGQPEADAPASDGAASEAAAEGGD